MEIKKIGIAGSGIMGSSMARIFAEYGYPVTLYNHQQPRLDRVKESMGALADRVTFTTELTVLAGNDLIIENLPENADIKHGFYADISPLVSDDTVVATNTSGMSINMLSETMKLPERFVGYHWVNPPHLMPLVEIIKNDHTRDDVAQAIYDVSLSIGKKPVIVKKDVAGFSMNRIQFAVIREALDQVANGVVSVEDMDNVVKYGIGIRWACMGPIESIDFGGLQTQKKIAEYMMPAICDSHEVPALLKEIAEQGGNGIQNGKGFYDYKLEEVPDRLAKRDAMLARVIAAKDV